MNRPHLISDLLVANLLSAIQSIYMRHTSQKVMYMYTVQEELSTDTSHKLH